MRPLVATAALVIILGAMKLAAGVVVPLLLAVTLAVAFRPIGEGLARRGFRPAITAITTILLVLLLLLGATWVVAQAGSTFMDSLPRYQASAITLREDAVAWMREHDMAGVARMVRHWDPSPYFMTVARDGLFGAGAALETLFLVVLITIFIQLEAATYRRKLMRVLGTAQPIREANAALLEVQRYLGAKVLLSLANGVVLGLWCWLFGVTNPLLWGVVAFLLNFIPYVGSLLAAIPPILLALVEGGPATAAAVGAGYIAVNLAENVVEPWLFGRTLDVSPLAVLLSMLLWGFVLGPVGALLSVPLTMVLRAAVAANDDLAWIATLLSETGTPKQTAPATDVAPAPTVR